MAIFSALFDRVIAVTDHRMAPSTYGLHVKGEQNASRLRELDSHVQDAQPKRCDLPGRQPVKDVAPSMAQPPGRLKFGDWKNKSGSSVSVAFCLLIVEASTTNTISSGRQSCVSIVSCVCDTVVRYTHQYGDTVFGIPFRLDDDQLDLAANARHASARVWRGGSRTSRHDGLASRPSSGTLNLRFGHSSSDLHVSGGRGVYARGPQRGGF